MGYNTDFIGQLSLSKPLSFEDSISLNEYLSSDHMKEEFPQYGIGTRWCDWRLEEDPAGNQHFVWNGSEKSYDMYEWMQFIYDKYLEPEGITLSGLVEAIGEDPTDRWAITFDAVNKKVKRLQGSISYQD